jgi:hypothetical protein
VQQGQTHDSKTTPNPRLWQRTETSVVAPSSPYVVTGTPAPGWVTRSAARRTESKYKRSRMGEHGAPSRAPRFAVGNGQYRRYAWYQWYGYGRPAVGTWNTLSTFQTVVVVRPMQDPGPPRPLCRRFGTASSMTTPRGAPWQPRWTPSLNQMSLTTRTSRACCLLWTFGLVAIDAVIFVARVHTWQAFSCFASRSDDVGLVHGLPWSWSERVRVWRCDTTRIFTFSEPKRFVSRRGGEHGTKSEMTSRSWDYIN